MNASRGFNRALVCTARSMAPGSVRPDRSLVLQPGRAWRHGERAGSRPSRSASIHRVRDDGSIPKDDPFVEEQPVRRRPGRTAAPPPRNQRPEGAHQEVVFEQFGRVRAVTTGPDGLLYVLLQNPTGSGTGLGLAASTPGMVIRLVPVDRDRQPGQATGTGNRDRQTGTGIFTVPKPPCDTRRGRRRAVASRAARSSGPGTRSPAANLASRRSIQSRK